MRSFNKFTPNLDKLKRNWYATREYDNALWHNAKPQGKVWKLNKLNKTQNTKTKRSENFYKNNSHKFSQNFYYCWMGPEKIGFLGGVDSSLVPTECIPHCA